MLHLAYLRHWRAAQRTGSYTMSTRGRTLARVGFIHGATAEQLAGVAQRFYRDADAELVVLTIDPDRLAAAGVTVRYEPPDPAAARPGTSPDGLFPHLYGPLPVTAVVRVRPAGFDDEGRFVVGR